MKNASVVSGKSGIGCENEESGISPVETTRSAPSTGVLHQGVSPTPRSVAKSSGNNPKAAPVTLVPRFHVMPPSTMAVSDVSEVSCVSEVSGAVSVPVSAVSAPVSVVSATAVSSALSAPQATSARRA